MSGWKSWIWAGLALSLYVFGGLLIMAGLVMIGILGAQDLWGWGEARSIGYMAFGIGIFSLCHGCSDHADYAQSRHRLSQ